MKYVWFFVFFLLLNLNTSISQTTDSIPASTDEMVDIVEEMPRFPGCEEMTNEKERNQCAQVKMLEFIYANVKYPSVARENGNEGTVVITYIIEKDGTIREAKILRDIGGGCGDAGLKVVNSMPKWIPGRQAGKPVRVQFNLPIRFRLEGRKFKLFNRKKKKN